MGIMLELSHHDLVNLVCGRPCPGYGQPYAKFVGNQWNDEWEWDRAALARHTEAELVRIYFGDVKKSAKTKKEG